MHWLIKCCIKKLKKTLRPNDVLVRTTEKVSRKSAIIRPVSTSSLLCILEWFLKNHVTLMTDDGGLMAFSCLFHIVVSFTFACQIEWDVRATVEGKCIGQTGLNLMTVNEWLQNLHESFKCSSLLILCSPRNISGLLAMSWFSLELRRVSNLGILTWSSAPVNELNEGAGDLG